MNITREQKEFIENIIKECSGYKENENLLDEFCNEVIRRAYSLVSDQKELNNIKIYIKRIANAAILDVIKNSVKLPVFNKNDIGYSEEALNIGYDCDENGDIALNYDITFEKISRKLVCLSEHQVNQVKEIISNIDEKNNLVFCKNIFDLKYSKGLNNNEIAKRLEINESEVDKKLLFMLSKIRKEVLCFTR